MRIEDLHKLANDYSKISIYGFGIAGKWLASNLNLKITGFIDTDSKKKGMSFNSIPVINYDDAVEQSSNEALIITSVIDIQDVLDLIKNIPHKNSVALGMYLENFEDIYANQLGETREFINYSLDAVKKCHEGYFDSSRLFLRSVDLVITEKCSLKCQDCSNLMQYYEEPKDIELEEIISDIDRLLENVDYIYEIRLIGGEPFMNKNIYDILIYLYTLSKIERIVIYTNGMIPVKKDKVEILRNKKLVFTVTNYGDIAKNTLKVIESLKELGVTYRVHEPEYWTDSGTVHKFSRTLQENISLFEQCCGKNLITLSAGKIYRCPFAANADRLQAIPDVAENYVAVGSSRELIKHYTREIDYLPACDFCKGRSFDAPTIVPALQAEKPIKYIKYKRDLID